MINVIWNLVIEICLVFVSWLLVFNFMPELPEVETIKLDLDQLIKNKIIKSVVINLPKQVAGSLGKFKSIAPGSKIISVSRRAKTLILDLHNNHHLIFHLKMTGQLIYQGKNKLAGGGHPRLDSRELVDARRAIRQNLENLPNKFSHVIFEFKDGSKLFFNDIRQFGWVKLVDRKGLEQENSKFGPEPLDPKFTFTEFKEIFQHKKQSIKPLLMDPQFIAGIGNIYAQEACFCVGVSPKRPANQLTLVELKKLYACIRKILKLAIKQKGTSSSDYVDAFGRRGSMEKFLKVYNRAGEPCFVCGSKLKLIRQSQRATCYCDKCQK